MSYKRRYNELWEVKIDGEYSALFVVADPRDALDRAMEAFDIAPNAITKVTMTWKEFVS